MNKRIFRVLAIIMILGLVLGAVGPIMISLQSSNPSDAQNQEQTAENTPAAAETAD